MIYTETKLDRLLRIGNGKRRTIKDARILRDFLLNDTIYKPMYVCTFGFNLNDTSMRHSINRWDCIEDQMDAVGEWFKTINRRCFHKHILPFVGYNAGMYMNNGKSKLLIQNDLHIVISVQEHNNKDKYNNEYYTRQIDKMKQLWKHSDDMKITRYYKSNDKCIFSYIATHHKEWSFPHYCSGRSSCRNKDKGKPNCIFSRKPHLQYK